MLLGGCATKFARMLRVGSVDAGLGPTAMFPIRLRRPGATGMCAAELACGVALLVTADGPGPGEPADAGRLRSPRRFFVAPRACFVLRARHALSGGGAAAASV